LTYVQNHGIYQRLFLKIIYHHRTRGDGAEGIHIGEMVSALEALGHKVQLVCPSASRRELGISLGMKGISSKEAKTKKGLFKLLVTHTLELGYNAISFIRLSWNIFRDRPDLVYERYSCYHFGGTLACRLQRVPLVLEVNSTYAGRFQRRKLAYPRLCRWIEDWVFRKSQLVCVVSEPLKACVEDRQVQSELVLVIPNAVNPNHRIQSDNVGKGIREELGIDQDAVVIGFVGSLRRWHGIEFLAEAIPSVVNRTPNCVFLIVGTGELEAEFKSSVCSKNLEQHVRFTGGVPYDSVPRYISAIDIGLMPDSNEWGSPMKILEYMLQAKPVVAPRLGPIEEIVENGQTGMLFERKSITDFVSIVAKLATDFSSRERIGKESQRYVLAERTWISNVEKVLSSFEKRYPSQTI
jgi:glycosyltransferase involved in cell wall biosynthesis